MTDDISNGTRRTTVADHIADESHQDDVQREAARIKFPKPAPEPPSQDSYRGQYDAAKKKLADKQSQLQDLQTRARALSDSVSREAVEEKKNHDANLFADGEISIEELQAANAERLTLEQEISVTDEARKVLEKRIENLDGEIAGETKQLHRLKELVMRGHIDVLLAEVPLEKIHAVVVWSRYVGQDPKLDKLFEVPWGKDQTGPIEQEILEGLDL